MGGKLAVAALAAASLAASTAWAAEKCAKSDEMSAMQTAAVQQELMVAALSCNAVTLYNAFVTGYQKELQASDKTLKSLFVRLGGKKGVEDYHAFKTRLANGSSIKSIKNITEFCANAQAAFSAALGPAKSTLSAFVSGHETDDTAGLTECEKKEAIEAMKAVKLQKPAENKAASAEQVAPAQGNAESATP
ncbi:MAG: hypothetical protein ACT4OG_02900 [Alphaproteobacteria bacterium]